MIVRPSPADFEGHISLDMRVSDKQGSELKQEIIDSVGRSQLFIQTTLPDRLVLTQEQFKSLQDYTEEMYHTTDRMFITPYNVMEVVIDREINTVQEIENVIVETEQLKRQREEDQGGDEIPAYTD